ncbi:MAG: class 1 fructose-bisphosphatase [Gemmatimonadota bacterium]|jgi:fructose-1,6-bisphosphatase I|nr:class 1 fructose-bisphosphatase [Gemmatimonadota bacterium]MDP6528396.1 class 1 fructose-bisphosphatase [Gemmatimonadota bacterium]MDP6802553.1 class 1 fructose-bisphosphatase [Gemmatimonadota bacterium]MDP7031816.1 class 1 fructose-bisphosphatase [Gemmatimonadota bacterium]
MRKGITCNRFILEEQKLHPEATGEFTEILNQIVLAAKIVSREVNKAGLIDILGATGETNVQGEQVQKLDIYANEQFIRALGQDCFVAVIASEENEDIILPNTSRKDRPGKYAVAIDPLDGSSNIDVNVSIGTIWSIHRRVTHGPVGQASDILRKGSEQIAGGYILYGASTMLVYTAGDGAHGFTLDPSVGEFLLSHEDIRMPDRGKIYSINEGNAAYWSEETRNWLEDLKRDAPSEGRPYSHRYIGSLVADFHRTLFKGGIFAYPMDRKRPDAPPRGKLRLLYEAAPMAFIAEQAGGLASTGTERVLDIQAEALHQRVPLFIGSREDVLHAESFLKDAPRTK